MKKVLTITVFDNEETEVCSEQNNLNGEQLIEAVAKAIYAGVSMIHATWKAGGLSDDEAHNAGGTAIMEALEKLKHGYEIASGSLAVKTKARKA